MIAGLSIHHVGYLVRDMANSRERFRELGYVEESPLYDDVLRKVDILFLLKDGYRIELVSPNHETSVVHDLMGKVGDSPYHLCYEAPDFDSRILALKASGYLLADPPAPAVALDGRRVAFLYRTGVGLIELLEVAP